MAEQSARGDFRSIAWGPRLLAPLALIVVAVLAIVIATSSLGGDDASAPEAGAPAPAASAKTKDEKKKSAGDESAKTYTVAAGDSLSTIAEKTGVSVADLEQLNPDVDPAALIEGQELKLR